MSLPGDPGELQALLRHHASCLVEAIDNGGLNGQQIAILHTTLDRMSEIGAALAAYKRQKEVA